MEENVLGSQRTLIGHPKRLPPAIKWSTYGLLALVFTFISLFSLILIYHRIAGKTSFVTFRSFSQVTFVYVFILLVVYYCLDGLRLFYILKTLESRIAFRHVMELVFINIFVSNVTPFATGGGFAQIYFLHRRGVSVGTATAATTIRTAAALVFFTIVTPVVLVAEKNLADMFHGSRLLLYLVSLPLGYMWVLYVMVRKKKKIKGVIYALFRFLHGKGIVSRKKTRTVCSYVFTEIDAFSRSMKVFLRGELRDVVMSVLSTLLFLFSLFMFSVILIYGLGYKISLLPIISFQIVVTFVMYFAPTPGATGVAEGGYALLFSHFVRKTDIVGLTFAWRFFTVYVGMVIGALILYMEVRKAHRVMS